MSLEDAVHQLAGVTLIYLPFFLVYFSQSNGVRIYPFRMDPREHPDYERYAVVHPPLDVFVPLPQFATLRDISTLDKHVNNYIELIDQYCLNSNTTLGHVIWPRDPDIMFADNTKAFIDYVSAKELYITSIHGFSPTVAGYVPPKDVLDYLDEKLESKWFGMSNGEQDGHYFGAFVRQELPLNNEPVDQYLNFREYFLGMETILGPKLTTLLSSTYPHHQLKSGLYTLAGAETSQHGPNAQLRYAFIRGAGKQYGVIWFGNVSVYNRFGHKKYIIPPTSSKRKVTSRADPKTEKDKNTLTKVKEIEKSFRCVSDVSLPGYGTDRVGDPYGPTCGTSLNLMKRLMYTQMLYNSGYVSFEDGWFYEDQNTTLSPIGLIQHNACLWTQATPLLAQGVHVPTIAVYLDFYGGWRAPRLKTEIFRTWTNLPYTAGDYLTDGLFRLIYPAYQDSSYFHDETGVSSPTPYGDAADVLLSDGPSWVLKRYDTVIVGGEISGSLEEQSNLIEYVASGGHLVLTVGNLAKFHRDAFNVTSDMNCRLVGGGSEIVFTNEPNLYEGYNMTVCDLSFHLPPSDYDIITKLSNGDPLIVRTYFPNSNGGSVTIFATPFAISATLVVRPNSEVDVSLPSPYPLLDHARKMFTYVLSNASIFISERNLSLVPMLLDSSANEFLLLVSNPELRELPLVWGSRGREVSFIEEIQLDQSEKGAVGYLPDGYEDADIGRSTNTTTAGGDTRLFRVRVEQPEEEDSKLKYITKITPKTRPKGIGLHLRHIEHSIRYEILRRPTFFQHYDSVVVDYSYIISKDDYFLTDDGNWLSQQGVRVYVDISPSINLFPTLRLVQDDETQWSRSWANVIKALRKAVGLQSRDFIVSLHSFPADQTKNKSNQDFNETFQVLAYFGAQPNFTVHILDTPKNPYSLLPLTRWLDENHLSSIQIVLNLAQLVNYGNSYKYDTVIQSRSRLLYFNAPGWDSYGTSYGNNVPITKVNDSTKDAVSKMLLHVCTLRQCPYDNRSMKREETTHSKNGGISVGKENTLRNIPGELKKPGTFYPLIMDSVYADLDEEFADIHFVESLLLQHSTI